MALENDDLATLLRRHRVAAGLTQEELAEQAGISTRTISDVERGLRATIYKDTAGRLAAALGLVNEERAEFEALGRRHARAGPNGLWARPVEDRTAEAGIPAQVTRLVGRERELIVVVAALKDPNRRLVTLTGTGGIGKTRIAVEAAVMAETDFGDGVFFVSLAVTRDPSRIASVIIRALGVRRAREPLLDALAERLDLGSCLLVLDTFEHVLPAAPLIADLLGRCRGLTILVTSREPLHLRGEHEFPVPILALPSPDQPVRAEHLTWYAATVLFVDRARAVKPDLVIDDHAAELIAEICRRLDGLPLAIELAAARVRHLPLVALRDHLEHRLHVLTGGPRDLPLRQQTMRDTVAWSYDLLDPTEQSLFRHLSVFAGGWTMESARSVCMPESELGEVFAGMSALVDKSLVSLREHPSEEPRYDMLDVIREYAAEQLQDLDGTDEALSRHAEYFVEMAERAEREIGKAGQERWFDRLDTDHENFRAALRWAIEKGNADPALRLGGALWQFWRSHGDYAEGRTWLRTALAVAPTASSDVRAKALWGAAGLAYHHGAYADAEKLSGELLPLARSTREPVHMRNALTIQGVVAMTQRRFSDAAEPLREALEICRSLGPSWLLGTSHLNLGTALMHSGDIDGARSNLEQAVTTYLGIGDRNFTARATEQLGYLELQTGDEQQARAMFRAALEAYHELDDRWGLAEAIEAFSALNAANGIADRAARLAGASDRLRDAFGAKALPADRVSIDRYLAAARQSLDHNVWQAAWEEGRQMPLEQAIELALLDRAEGDPTIGT
jgi:predicted ATPase/transcriptional regulator with XRE-family HTH domain